MTTRRIVRRQPESAPRFSAAMHPVLARIYASRQLISDDEIEHSLQSLIPFDRLAGMDRAVDLLVTALDESRRIMVIADFDADGATSCAVALRALRQMGAADVRYLVPNRFEYGYGLTPEIVTVAAGQQPDLLITVDNGISSVDGVAAAKRHGMRVLITDHHLPGPELPAADAIVNPNQPGDDFPSKHLAGVGVVFYVMLALRARLRTTGWFERNGRSAPNLAQLLDLVALGTVADVVRLDRNNRILVAQGVARIRRGLCVPGITALLNIAGRRPRDLVAGDLGFAVGPRLNAAGRLEDMSLGIECLLSDSDDAALALARRLDDLNRERRTIESTMQEQALALLGSTTFGAGADPLPPGLCLFDEQWHQGVIGILASRIKDRTHRPVVVFAAGDTAGSGAGELKGSARSIPGLHIRDVLEAVAAQHAGLITRFGGHAMAAGLSLPRDNLDRFTAAFTDELQRRLTADDLRGVIYTDGELEPEYIDLEVAEILRTACPWGQGFPEPVFDGVFRVLQRRIVGGRHLKLRLGLPDDARCFDAIAFNTSDASWPDGELTARIAYRLDVNEFNGRRSAQLVVEHIVAPAGEAAV